MISNLKIYLACSPLNNLLQLAVTQEFFKLFPFLLQGIMSYTVVGLSIATSFILAYFCYHRSPRGTQFITNYWLQICYHLAKRSGLRSIHVHSLKECKPASLNPALVFITWPRDSRSMH